MVVPAQRGVNGRSVSLLGSANLVRPRLHLDGPSNIASRHSPGGDRSDTGPALLASRRLRPFAFKVAKRASLEGALRRCSLGIRPRLGADEVGG
jgi:hypothetical protein